MKKATAAVKKHIAAYNTICADSDHLTFEQAIDLSSPIYFLPKCYGTLGEQPVLSTIKMKAFQLCNLFDRVSEEEGRVRDDFSNAMENLRDRYINVASLFTSSGDVGECAQLLSLILKIWRSIQELWLVATKHVPVVIQKPPGPIVMLNLFNNSIVQNSEQPICDADAGDSLDEYESAASDEENEASVHDES